MAKNEKVKDMSMTDEVWSTRTTPIEEFLTPAKIKELKANAKEVSAEALEEMTESIALIRSQLKRGNKSSGNRVKYYNIIKEEGREIPGWPVKQGHRSTQPQHVQDSMTEMKELATTAFVNFWNDNPIVQVTALISDRNTTLGGSPYPDAESYAKAKVAALSQRFIKHATPQKDDAGNLLDARWDGIFSLEGMTISPLGGSVDEVEAQSDEVDSDESN